MPLFQLDNVSKIYKTRTGPLRALDAVNLEIEAGEFLCLRGESGAGKSTLLNVLCGVTRPTRGRVYFWDKNLYPWIPWGTARFRNRNIGFIFQDFQLMPGLTVFQNIQLPLLFAGSPGRYARREIPKLLEELGIGDKIKQYPHQLSGGESQRVAIARALINRPPVVIADEPTGNLDANTEKTILKLLKRQKKEFGFTLIAVSHSAGFARGAGRVLDISAGRLMEKEKEKEKA